jgi:anti-sigma regulatory factor (Ser/Thr protein kinase)
MATHTGQATRGSASESRAPTPFGLMSSTPGTSRLPVDDVLNMRLRGNTDAPAQARRALGQLRADLDAPLMETLRLLVTELVSNSVRHAGARAVTLKVAVARTAVLTEVTDDGPGFDPDRTGTPRADSTGWGLFLVERLAQRWGVVKEGKATRVWFELPRV